MAKVYREKEMAVPVVALYEAISDFESYPQFLPEVVSAKVETKSNSKVVVNFELEIIKRFQYSLEFNVVPEREVRWNLLKSNFFKQNDGSWFLSKSSSGTTLVKYELEVGFGFLVPGWVSKKLTEVNLPRMMESFEERAKVLATHRK